MAHRGLLRRLIESELARPLFLIVAVFVLWQLVIDVFHIPPYLIPAPLAVAKMLVAEWPRLWRESLVTGYATLGGFGLSILLGIPIAMAIAAVVQINPLAIHLPDLHQCIAHRLPM